jgi:ABC-type uncharacterized transport system substrate-binding protein
VEPTVVPPVVQAVPEAAPPVEPPLPAPAPAPEPEPVAVQVAILLSDDIPVFASVADKIRRRLGPGDHTIHDLGGHPANSTRILEEIERTNPDQLVSVGLLAAQVGRQLDTVPMVFCYVFNYQDHDLISPSSKGVNLLPPFEMQLDAWRDLSPGLSRIGVITGPNQEALVGELQQASEAEEIELFARTVHSDQEALYAFKRLTPEIEGLMLLPDNRILSPRVVREIMSYGARHRIQIVVFGSSLLDLGAFMAITSLDSDIADQVVARLGEMTDEGWPAGIDMTPLTKMEREVNPDVAQHLGLIQAERSARSDRAE